MIRLDHQKHRGIHREKHPDRCQKGQRSQKNWAVMFRSISTELEDGNRNQNHVKPKHRIEKRENAEAHLVSSSLRV